MTEGSLDQSYCRQCGNALDAGAKFCGSCGQAVLSTPESAEQIVPRSDSALQSPDRSARRGRIALLSIGLLAIAVVLLGAGAISVLAFGDRFGLAEDAGDLRRFQGEVATPMPEETSMPEASTPEIQERTLDYVVDPEPEATATTGGPDPGSEARFLYAYFSAASNRDWYFTYQALSDDSKNLFTEEEWIEAQDARIAQSGGSAPLQDLEILSLIGDASGATADVELTFEDGTQETITDVGISVEGEQFKRDLTPDEISYLQGLLEDDTSSNPECGIWGCPDENGEYTSGPPSE